MALEATSIAALAVGGLIAAPAIPVWYAGLAKPGWTPPDWLFGPVWTILYLTMAYAAWRVWVTAPPSLRWLYALQLVLNILWTPLFFGFHQPALALVDNIVLVAAVAATGFFFWHHDRLAGLLFLPYLAWTAYAASLTAGIVVLAA